MEISKDKHYLVRAYAAGVFAGEIESMKDKEVTMKNARRLWYWSGAASLSQLAMEGVKNPHECKFPCEMSRVHIKDVIEVIEMTGKARDNIKAVPVWEAGDKQTHCYAEKDAYGGGAASGAGDSFAIGCGTGRGFGSGGGDKNFEGNGCGFSKGYFIGVGNEDFSGNG